MFRSPEPKSLASRNLAVIHILNKKSSNGGIESLVDTVIQSSDSSPFPHEVFFIARKKFEIFLFGMPKFRIFVFLLSYGRLIKLILRSKRDVDSLFLIFHHAEAHLLLWMAKPLLKLFNSVSSIVYLHQSFHLYPKKLRRITYKLLETNPSIAYSSKIFHSWSLDETSGIRTVIHAIPRQPGSLICKSLDECSVSFLFVGRDVSWKRLDLAIEFVDILVKKGVPATLTVVGGNIFDLNERFRHRNHFPPVNFLGTVKAPPYGKVDFLINTCDYNLSAETVGIAGLEAISFGTPILIRNLEFTDYSGFPGIIEIDYLLETINSFNTQKEVLNYLKSQKLSAEQLNSWKSELSIGRYLDQLENFIIGFKN